MFKSLTGNDKRPPARGGGTPAAAPTPPGTVQWAVKFMLAGAAASTIFLIFGVIVTASERNSLINSLIEWNKKQPKSKQLTLTQIHNYATISLVTVIIVGLISVGLWLWMARMNTAGRNWARITATVLFVLWTYYTYQSIGATRGAITLVLATIFVLVIWVIGLGALYFLWRPDSTAYFKSRSSSS
jgi:hypothetical protein